MTDIGSFSKLSNRKIDNFETLKVPLNVRKEDLPDIFGSPRELQQNSAPQSPAPNSSRQQSQRRQTDDMGRLRSQRRQTDDMGRLRSQRRQTDDMGRLRSQFKEPRNISGSRQNSLEEGNLSSPFPLEQNGVERRLIKGKTPSQKFLLEFV